VQDLRKTIIIKTSEGFSQLSTHLLGKMLELDDDKGKLNAFIQRVPPVFFNMDS